MIYKVIRKLINYKGKVKRNFKFYKNFVGVSNKMIMKMRKKMLKDLKLSQQGEMMFLNPSGNQELTLVLSSAQNTTISPGRNLDNLLEVGEYSNVRQGSSVSESFSVIVRNESIRKLCCFSSSGSNHREASPFDL